MNCGIGHRCGSDLALLWLWCRLAAVAPISPPAWEPPYVVGVALKRQKTKKEFFLRVPVVAQWIQNPTNIHENAGSIPGSAQWVKGSYVAVAVYRLVAAALIRPLAWELPYAAGVAIKRKKQLKIKFVSFPSKWMLNLVTFFFFFCLF